MPRSSLLNREELLERQAFQLSLVDRIRHLSDPVDIMTSAAEALGSRLDVARCGYGDIVEGGEVVRVERDWVRPGEMSLAGEARMLDAFGPAVIQELRKGRTLIVDDCRTDPRSNAPEYLPTWESIDTQALIVVPIKRDNVLTAILFVHSKTPREWTQAEIALAEDVALRTDDAVKRARAEAERRRSEERYRSLFNSIDAGFCVIETRFDATGKCTDYRFLEVNHAFEHYTGLADATGRWMRDLAPGHEQHWFDIYGQVARTGEPVRFELPASALGGRWYLVHAYRVDDPALNHVAILFSDLTERRRAEQDLAESRSALVELNRTLEQRVAERTAELQATQEALRQTQKLEAMGQLTGGVAHDFNNLLTPILGGLDLLSRRISGDRERRLIGGALQSAERAKTLVQRLLAFARRQPLQPTAVDLGALVKGMADLVASTTGPQIRVATELADHLPLALADANQVEMAILNLAVNARDAMPDGGTLTIGAVLEPISADHSSRLAPGRYICLSVTDTGIGMDEATLARAIEPFFSTKGIGKGTGLGLSMVHGLTAQLGGALTINSKPGIGSRIELWLPVSEAKPEAQGQPEGSGEQGKRRGRVLLVDDEELARLSTADMLVELGYAAVETASAEEALKALAEDNRFDLVISDHLMPGMSGAQLARTIQAQWPHLPVLMITGYAEAAELTPDLPRLTKPFRQAELWAAMEPMI